MSPIPLPTVLIVDDDARLLKMLQRTLSYQGLQVLTATNGLEALEQVDAHHPQVIILDWMMPRMDGLSVLQELRQEGNRSHVLMLTARDALDNRVEGLESGADDYLVKPFAPAELVARVRAMLRRAEGTTLGERITFAGVSLDPQIHTARRGELHLELTPTEFELLAYFLRHPHQVLERAQILTNVWGYDFHGDDNVLEVYVGYLRKKLEAEGCSRLIHTVRGIGYVLKEA